MARIPLWAFLAGSFVARPAAAISLDLPAGADLSGQQDSGAAPKAIPLVSLPVGWSGAAPSLAVGQSPLSPVASAPGAAPAAAALPALPAASAMTSLSPRPAAPAFEPAEFFKRTKDESAAASPSKLSGASPFARKPYARIETSDGDTIFIDSSRNEYNDDTHGLERYYNMYIGKPGRMEKLEIFADSLPHGGLRIRTNFGVLALPSGGPISWKEAAVKSAVFKPTGKDVADLGIADDRPSLYVLTYAGAKDFAEAAQDMKAALARAKISIVFQYDKENRMVVKGSLEALQNADDPGLDGWSADAAPR